MPPSADFARMDSSFALARSALALSASAPQDCQGNCSDVQTWTMTVGYLSSSTSEPQQAALVQALWEASGLAIPESSGTVQRVWPALVGDWRWRKLH